MAEEDAPDVVLLGRRKAAFLALQAEEPRLAEMQDEGLADGLGGLQREVVEHSPRAPGDTHLFGGEEHGATGIVRRHVVRIEGHDALDVRRDMLGGKMAQALVGAGALRMEAVDEDFVRAIVNEVLVHGKQGFKRGDAE